MARAYDIRKGLLHFFADPAGFRLMQSRTGAIVSGSFALQFFTREYYPLADFDIYVELAKGVQVGRWLMENGYSYVPSKRDHYGSTLQQPDDFELSIKSLDYGWIGDYFKCKGVKGVLNFFRDVDGTTKKVQLIVTELCAIRTILSFHSSKCSALSKTTCSFWR